MDFLDIILEAKGDKKKTPTTKLTPVDDKQNTDYTQEEDDTADTEETPEETDAADDTAEDEDTSTDYTEEEDESDPEEDGADPDGDDAGDDDSTDYTSETDDTDGGEDTTDTSTDTTEQPAEDEDKQSDDENNRVLLDDYTNLYFLIKNTLTKLSNVDKSNILINKIVTQISTNLNVLKKQLFEFITFSFSRGKYVTNLYKYNYFLEAFKINVEMLKKISVFIPNSQNN